MKQILPLVRGLVLLFPLSARNDSAYLLDKTSTPRLPEHFTSARPNGGVGKRNREITNRLKWILQRSYKCFIM